MAAIDTLTLGSITFQDFELPNGNKEGLTSFGGIVKLAVFDFPGGMRSVQSFGPFDAEKAWSGTIFGGNAIQRALQMDYVRKQAQSVALTYNAWSYDVVVKEWLFNVKNENEVDYSIRLVPYNDRNSQSSPSSPTTGLPPVAPAINMAQQQANSPANGFTFDPGIPSSVTNLNNSLQNAFQQSQNSLGNISSATLNALQSNLNGIRSGLAPLISGTDPAAASAASDLDSTLQVLDTILDQDSLPLAVVPAVNPNLYALASLYYNDPSQWKLIVEANGLNDPFPQVAMTLLIPQLPVTTAAQPLTWVA
jgi:hypothetical protein